MTVVDANNIIVADSRLDPLLSPVASENQRGEIGSGISNARGISKAQSLEGKIGNRLPWIDGLGRAQCHTTPLAWRWTRGKHKGRGRLRVPTDRRDKGAPEDTATQEGSRGDQTGGGPEGAHMREGSQGDRKEYPQGGTKAGKEGRGGGDTQQCVEHHEHTTGLGGQVA